MIEEAMQYVDQKLAVFLAGYKELLRIPSISTDPAFKQDLLRCAAWIVTEMERLGLHECRTIDTAGHPVVYGEWLEAGPSKPTVLVYAHYDVQPVDPLESWVSPPFDPTERDGRLYARGAIDDKCGIWANLKAIEAMFAADGTLPINIKVIFEGEEEQASPNMAAFVRAHSKMLAADAILLCDGVLEPDRPISCYALRGAVAAEVVIQGPKKDLHSGIFGGMVQNPLHVMGRIVGSFHDEAGRIRIPGFYDKVAKLERSEIKAMHAHWDIVKDQVTEASTVDAFWADSLGTPAERGTALPTLDVNGVAGGYQGAGLKTIIPAEASFKVSMRLVAKQDPDEIARLFSDYVRSFATDTVTIDVNILATGWPLTMELDGQLVDAVMGAIKAATGKTATLARSGGSVPIGGMFQQALKVPISVLGIGVGENLHSPNEYLDLKHFRTGIETMLHFFYAYGAR
jgi:acetylornithine deacetylase/succinyl-diaminopimelate desuccinylase-like protein